MNEGYPWYEPKQTRTRMEGKMLHLAVLLESGVLPERVVHFINRQDHVYLWSRVHADTSVDALKKWVTARIQQAPSERWLILSGNTIAEVSPTIAVRFRSVVDPPAQARG